MNGICYIIGAGDFVAQDDEKQLQYSLNNRTEDDLLIAADGGLKHLRRLHVRPDVIIGDFDSLEESPKPKEADCILRLPVEKDDTDIGAAIALGRQKGFVRFEIYGAIGGERVDHTIGNLSLALGLKKAGCSVHLYGRDCMCHIISGGERCELTENVAVPSASCAAWGEEKAGDRHKKHIVSVFSATPEAKGVTIKGLKYSLCEATLTAVVPLGISNEWVLGEQMEKPVIKLWDGVLVIFQQKC